METLSEKLEKVSMKDQNYFEPLSNRHPRTKDKQFIVEYHDGTIVKRKFRDIVLAEDPLFVEENKPLNFNYYHYTQNEYESLTEEEKDWVTRYNSQTEYNRVEHLSSFDFLPVYFKYLSIAQKTPYRTRMCWCCGRKAKAGKLFCLSHSNYHKFLTYCQEGSK